MMFFITPKIPKLPEQEFFPMNQPKTQVKCSCFIKKLRIKSLFLRNNN